MPEKAVVLLSGGMDSSTALAMAKADGFDVIALSVDYGQRHRRELESAKRVARHFGIKDHRVIQLDLEPIGGSALTDRRIKVPEQRTIEEIGRGIPSTYVPARNTILLSYALGLAEATGARAIYIAANAVDYSVDGAAQVWVRTDEWAKLITIREFYELPEADYSTLSVNPRTLHVEWRPVNGRFRHNARSKRCYIVSLERGQEITVTEDHSLFSLDPATANLVAVKGSKLRAGMPLVVPFDLSRAAATWSEDLETLGLDEIESFCRRGSKRWSVRIEDGVVTNRLRRTRVPVDLPVTDDLLYIVGLWLAEGGKDHSSAGPALPFSIGSIPGAPELLKSYFAPFSVGVAKSPENDFDYTVSSSVFSSIFDYLGLYGTSRKGEKHFPSFFWDLSQRQRRIVIAGLWDGDGSRAFKHQAVLAQKSHDLIRDTYHCLTLDGIFPIVKNAAHGQKQVVLGRARDYRRFIDLYPFRHASKRASYEVEASVHGRDKATGVWKCQGLWDAVSYAPLEPGEKTKAYNRGGKYDSGVRAQRCAFSPVRSLKWLVASDIAFLQVVGIEECRADWMYDLAVPGSENFIANGILAHNSGYPDCRPEFYKAFQEVARLGTKRGVEGDVIEIRTPLIAMSKADIVRKGEELGVPWALTWSCYQGEDKACGVCDSCQLRLKGFREAGVKDPIPYARRPRTTQA